MYKKQSIIFLFLFSVVKLQEYDRKYFPQDFLFGVGTSSYQVEGAWNADGKSENNWDYFTHSNPGSILDRSNGDVACDSYHQVDRDVKMIKDLGVHYYRFSLSWSRIIPDPSTNKVNQPGINYYNKLINLLLSNGIQPMVTIFHWDLPQSLQKSGGFLKKSIIDYYVNYARVAFQNFGDRVKFWTTFNEPHSICMAGYGGPLLAPAYNLSGTGDYLCAYHMLKAHAAAYHLYNNTFKQIQNGRVSINLDSPWHEPKTNSSADIEASRRAMEFYLGLFAHPLFSLSGDYPEVVKQAVKDRSLAEGFPKSRLPEFTKEEIKYIKGAADYFCLNHYGSALVNDKKPNAIGAPSLENDQNVAISYDPLWPRTLNPDQTVVPWGLTKILKWIKKQYGNPDIYITENGFGLTKNLLDYNRIVYQKLYLKATLNAIYNYGVRVKSYTAWSLMDNFEWYGGYLIKFGLYHVNFSSPNRITTPRLSANYYKKVIATRKP